MEINNLNFEFNWTNDCQGKQDLDFDILTVSTRYWPNKKANPSICIGQMNENYIQLSPDEYIEGKTESECKFKTESWIKEKLELIIPELVKLLESIKSDSEEIERF